MSRPPATRLSHRLREAVLTIHRRIETLPFFAALTDRSLSVERYVDQLRAMAIVETTMERAIGASQDPNVMAIRSAASKRSRLLLDDLAFFDRRGPLPDDPATTAVALEVADGILKSSDRPATLIGLLYVSQGVTLGNHLHQDDAKALAGGIPGATWYAGLGDETHPRFRAFCDALDALDVDEESRQEIVTSAVSAVTSLESLHLALDPQASSERRFLATTFNPEAGSHDVPADEVRVAAALRAGAGHDFAAPWAAASLLLSAVADESGGFSGAVEALTSWYSSDRFPASWHEAVDTLVRDAFVAAHPDGSPPHAE